MLILRKFMLKYLRVKCHGNGVLPLKVQREGESKKKCGQVLAIVKSRWRGYQWLLYYSFNFSLS